jgi:GDP-L-fucose synthase
LQRHLPGLDVPFVEGTLHDLDTARTACHGCEMVFHVAATVAGVGYNSKHPATLVFDNTTMGLNVMQAAVAEKVGRVLLCSSACVYRRHCGVPTQEDEGFMDDPEPTNFGYGWSKRYLEVLGRSYVDEYGIEVALPRPYNAYGPRDDFEWETNHVIPALIRKVLEGHDPLTVWGDGTQTRTFLYATDFVAGLMLAMERHAVCQPINIGTSEEISVRHLIELICELCGKTPRLVFDTSAPQGQPRRLGDISKAAALGFEPRVPLREGLRRTIDWYQRTM